MLYILINILRVSVYCIQYTFFDVYCPSLVLDIAYAGWLSPSPSEKLFYQGGCLELVISLRLREIIILLLKIYEIVFYYLLAAHSSFAWMLFGV